MSILNRRKTIAPTEGYEKTLNIKVMEEQIKESKRARAAQKSAERARAVARIGSGIKRGFEGLAPKHTITQKQQFRMIGGMPPGMKQQNLYYLEGHGVSSGRAKASAHKQQNANIFGPDPHNRARRRQY